MVSGEGNLGKYGVIRSSSDVDRTCVVKWFSTTGEELGIEEDVSVYDLRENEDMVFNPGDLVVAMNSACVVEGGPRGVAGQVHTQKRTSSNKACCKIYSHCLSQAC